MLPVTLVICTHMHAQMTECSDFPHSAVAVGHLPASRREGLVVEFEGGAEHHLLVLVEERGEVHEPPLAAVERRFALGLFALGLFACRLIGEIPERGARWRLLGR